MKTDNAFPVHGGNGDDTRNHTLGGGLTKREIFAKDAPEPPEWFKHKSKLKLPDQPKSWVSMVDGDDKDLCKNWQYDPCFDLPDHLQWYQSSWEDYHKKAEEHNQSMYAEKYFAWRLYFADELLKALES